MTPEQQTETVQLFLSKLLPWRDQNPYVLEPGHKLQLDRLDNGNFRLFKYSEIGGEWHPMTSIEVAVHDKWFWNNVVTAVRTLLGITFQTADPFVAAGIQVGNPGIGWSFLQFEEGRETRETPKPTKKAGRKERAKERKESGIVTIASKGGTKKRKVLDTGDDPDLLDAIDDQ